MGDEVKYVRDTFAAFAMQGLVAGIRDDIDAEHIECIVRTAFDIADAMVAESDRRDGE